jgi:hypothetical protein
MNLKSEMGLFPIDTGWILEYPDPNDDLKTIKEHYEETDQGVIELLYAIMENCLHRFNSKHNNYNIIIKRVKVKK